MLVDVQVATVSGLFKAMEGLPARHLQRWSSPLRVELAVEQDILGQISFLENLAHFLRLEGLGSLL